MIPVVAIFGLVVSFLSGLLGIGGGIIMAPLLLYGPPLLGIGQLDMKTVAGLTIVQGLLASVSGVISHRRSGNVSRQLVICMGTAIILGSLSGAIFSQFVDAHVLLGIFAGLAALAAALMLLPKRDQEDSAEGRVVFRRPLAIVISLSVGFLGGMVGQAGAFILVPLMLYVLKLPTRITIGSSLGIVLCSSFAGFLGKLTTGQIPLSLALALALGAVVGAQAGGLVSKRMTPRVLRTSLALVIAVAALRMWADFFSSS